MFFSKSIRWTANCACVALAISHCCGCALKRGDRNREVPLPSELARLEAETTIAPVAQRATPQSAIDAATGDSIRRLPSVPDAPSSIRLVSHQQPIDLDAPANQPRALSDTASEQIPIGPIESEPPDPDPASPDSMEMAGTHPIDLANALGIGGASHLQVQLARERVIEAQAKWLKAKTLWLPNLRFGLGWNRHDGRLQETRGDVIEVSRNSLFVGGGAGLDGASLAGGSGGPARLMVNLSLADAYFERHAACWDVRAEQANVAGTFNDSQLDIAIAYFDLLQAHGRLANSREGEAATRQMLNFVTLFSDAGRGSPAEVDRAKAELAYWQQGSEEARRMTKSRSAELTRLLRLDHHVTLVPIEEKIAPIELVDSSMPVQQFVAQALSTRPELSKHQALVKASLFRMNQEHWRPWLPNVQAGASAGMFGGGSQSKFTSVSDRSDADVLAVWELQNIGYGNKALYRQRASQVRQARSEAEWIHDTIITEVVTAANDVASYHEQMNTAFGSVSAANQSYERNLQRVREGEGLPLELLQAIRARTGALDAYTKAVADYCRAQFHLIRAIGEPPGMPVKED